MKNKKIFLGIAAFVVILGGLFAFFNSRGDTGDLLGRVQRERQVRTSAPPSLPSLPAPSALPAGGAPSALPSGTPQAALPSAQINTPSAPSPSVQRNTSQVRGPVSSPLRRRNTSQSGLPTLPPSSGGGNSQPYSIQQVNSFLAGVSNAPSNYTIASGNPISSQSSIDFANDIKGLIIDEGNIVGVLVDQEAIADGLSGRFTGGLMDEPGAGNYSADDLFNMVVVHALDPARYQAVFNQTFIVIRDSDGDQVGTFVLNGNNGNSSAPSGGDQLLFDESDPGSGTNGQSGASYYWDENAGEWLPYDDSDINNDGGLNSQEGDIDGDGILNNIDPDDDNDGVMDGVDSDPDNPYQGGAEHTDVDGDGTVNDYDSDMDGDGISNSDDNDIDGDGYTNNVDTDDDGDGVADNNDNSPSGASDEDEDEDEDADADGDEDDDDDGSGDIWSDDRGYCKHPNSRHCRSLISSDSMEQIGNLINSYLNGGSTTEQLEQMIEQQLGTQVNVQDWVMVDNLSQQAGFSAPANTMPINQFQIQIWR